MTIHYLVSVSYIRFRLSRERGWQAYIRNEFISLVKLDGKDERAIPSC